MKLKNSLRSFVLAGSIISSFCLQAQESKMSLNSSDKVIWAVKSESDVPAPAALFGQSFESKNWVKATVPGTVFGSYVLEGLEKDPNFADNIYNVDKAKYDRNFWYRTTFEVPANFDKEKLWLNFEGVNRKADVYLNGKYIGKLDGFMERGKFEVSAIVFKNKPNVLAVLVVWPQTPIPNYASPTYISSSGWDWMPYVPGCLSGITDDVYLSNSGSITIQDPWVRTDSLGKDKANISVSVEMKNNSDKELEAVLSGVINPGNIEFSRNVKLGANTIRSFSFNKKFFSQLAISNPKLWWPNGYGDQNLYSCELKVTAAGKESDSRTVNFGIRQYSYDTLGSVLHIKVNGIPVFLKGGNWGMSEYMLRCRGNEYDTKVRLHKEMNYNIIRNWIGSTTDEEFYQACDKYGIMVWDDFWLNSHPNLPEDVFAFNKNAVEKIKRLRNYACIALWCGDNEGYPVPPINNWLREDVRVFDGDDRWYHANSHSDALTGSGVWVNLEPQGYFASPPLGFGGNTGWGLRSEMGTAVFVNYESFKKFIPEDKMWPRNEMWDKHFFGPSANNAGPDAYVKTINTSYGDATGIEDFCKKAQLLNIETNKAIYEGWVDHMWNDASGIIIWMSQSAYPSMVWQTYDYYYDLTGAYWGAKKACEPLHILWNCANNSIKVTNTSNEDFKGLRAEASVYNKDGKEITVLRNSEIVDAAKNTANECFVMKFEDDKNLAFLKPTFASSFTKDAGEPKAATDGGVGSRWGSEYNDNQWLCVDLGSVTEFNSIALNWENAYAKAYKLQVSNDTIAWTDIYSSDSCQGGREYISVSPVKARFVRMLGLKRATDWGYSLWEMKIFKEEKAQKSANALSDVHFIKLSLKDGKGKLLSDNFYWRGNKYLDYTGLNTMPKVKLQVNSKQEVKEGKVIIKASVKNPVSSAAIAFAVRVQLVNERTGESILPVFTNDNYFSLLKGESKDIQLEFDASLIGKDKPKLVVEAYNPGLSK